MNQRDRQRRRGAQPALSQAETQEKVISALLRPLQHLEVAPSALQSGLLKLIEALPLLVGDELYEALEEPHAGLILERALSARSRLCCKVEPHAPQKLQAQTAPTRPEAYSAIDCLILLSSQRSFRSPQAPRPRLTLKEALSLSLTRFKDKPELQLILIATDTWDAKIMKEHMVDFKERLAVAVYLVDSCALLSVCRASSTYLNTIRGVFCCRFTTYLHLLKWVA